MGASRTLVAADSDVINCGDIAAIDGVAKITIAAWTKRTSAGSIVAIGKRTGGGGGANQSLILPYSDGVIYFAVSNGSNAYGTVINNVTTWQHLALVFDGTLADNPTRLKGFINGAPQSLSFVGTVPTTTANCGDFKIGQADDFGHGDMSFAHCLLYTDALTADQIAEIMWKPGSLPASCVGYWAGFESGNEPDRSGSGNTGANTGAAEATDGPPVSIGELLRTVRASAAAVGGGSLLVRLQNEGLFCNYGGRAA